MVHGGGGQAIAVRLLIVSPLTRKTRCKIVFQMFQSLGLGGGMRGHVNEDWQRLVPFKIKGSICVMFVLVRSDVIVARAYIRHWLKIVICFAENDWRRR